MATIAKEAKNAAATIQWFRDAVKRGKGEIFSEVVTLTPGVAAEMLQHNTDNRNIQDTKLIQFISDIKGGRWVLNGEPIIISTTGELNDGQHRCQAVIDANRTIKTMVTFGLPRVSRMTLDQGRARTAGDYLQMEGYSYGTAMGAIARLIVAYEQNGGQSVAQVGYVTNGQIRQRVSNDLERFTEAAAFADAHHSKAVISKSILGMCYYLFYDICPEDAKTYLHQLTSGEDVTKGSPALAVRNRLTEMSRGLKQARIEVVMHGWNAFRRGRTLKQARSAGRLPTLV